MNAQENNQNNIPSGPNRPVPQVPSTVPPPEPASQRTPPLTEKKEFFVRREIRTMRKDMSRLLEAKSLKEREKMAQLKVGEEVQKEKARIEQLRKEEEEKMFAVKELRAQERDAISQERKVATQEPPAAPETPKAPPPKPSYRLPFSLPGRPSFLDKFLSRAVILGVVIAFWGIIITFWYWYFFVKNKAEEPPAPPATEQPSLPTGETPGPEETPETTQPETPQLPASFIPMDKEYFIEFSDETELPNLFSQSVKQYGGENVLTRIIMLNKTSGVFVTLTEFSRIFEINAPPGLLEGLSQDATFFVYSSKIANRFGFAARLESTENFTEKMRGWENTLEQNTERLFQILEKTEPAINKNFRQAAYRGVAFRYISFPSINFGIVWSIVKLQRETGTETDSYLLFTSSGESMMKTIDRVTNRIVP